MIRLDAKRLFWVALYAAAAVAFAFAYSTGLEKRDATIDPIEWFFVVIIGPGLLVGAGVIGDWLASPYRDD